MSEHLKKWLKLLVQIAISIALIIFVIRRVDLTQLHALVFRPEAAGWLCSAFFLFNLSKIFSALRLNIYQRHISLSLSERENLKLYYASMFLNIFLPGGIGGDGYKVYVLHRLFGISLKSLIGVVLVDRISGLLLLLLLLCFLLPTLPLDFHHLVLTASACAVVLCIALVGIHIWMLRMQFQKMMSISAYGLLVQILQLACVVCLLVYFQTPTGDFPAYLAVFLVSSVAAVLPISFGGLGAREITALYALGYMQLDSTYGVIASSFFFLITVLSSLIGILFLGRFSRNRHVSFNHDG